MLSDRVEPQDVLTDSLAAYAPAVGRTSAQRLQHAPLIWSALQYRLCACGRVTDIADAVLSPTREWETIVMKSAEVNSPVARGRRLLWVIGTIAVLLVASLPREALAVPAFNRQTGQNCVACHAGGQFPELTPYGRMFKMTGYTLGQRTVPISAMALVSYSKVRNTSTVDNPGDFFQKNGSLIVPTASLFLAGKITDNIGAFAQITYDHYATQDANGAYHGHSNADNIDLRYADRFINSQRDVVVGISVNNNPSVSDPWNTAAAWMQYVPVPSPGSSQFIDGASPYPSYATGGNIAGVSAYTFWNRTVYAELGGYATSSGLLSFMSAGIPIDSKTKLQGINPYWRLALNHEWGPHSLMVGTGGMNARVYDNPLDTSDSSTTHHFYDANVDAQYQYLLDPHSVTAHFVYAHNKHRYPDSQVGQVPAFVDASGNPLASTATSDTTDVLRAKLTYVYQARYGSSVALFNQTGSTNTGRQTSGYDPVLNAITADPSATAPSQQVSGNLSGNPGTRGYTLEAFFMPIQYMRIGAQYTGFNRYNGASRNYDGFGRNASDNNSLFVYLWAAY